MDYGNKFRVEPGSRVRLHKIATDFGGRHGENESVEMELAQQNQKLHDLQYLLYAENKRSLLICLQAMDAGGKDGTINHVFSAMNPQGTRVCGFKTPSREETGHDFLWRIHKQTPVKGEVVIFNRSQYEDVLTARVNKLVPKSVWLKRYSLINDFEKNLIENGTHILKFYLHISADEQLQRFKQRLDNPARHWKITDSDYSERKLWKKYLEAYEDVLEKTSTKHAPWFVIPADHKGFRNLAVSRIVTGTLNSLGMKFPAPVVNIEEIRRQYHAAARDKNV